MWQFQQSHAVPNQEYHLAFSCDRNQGPGQKNLSVLKQLIARELEK